MEIEMLNKVIAKLQAENNNIKSSMRSQQQLKRKQTIILDNKQLENI